MTAKSGMPKTVRPKRVVKDNIAYDQCPYRGCGFLARDWGFDPRTGMGKQMLDEGEEMENHIREVHGYIWRSKGKSAGWWHVSKFHDRAETPK